MPLRGNGAPLRDPRIRGHHGPPAHGNNRDSEHGSVRSSHRLHPGDLDHEAPTTPFRNAAPPRDPRIRGHQGLPAHGNSEHGSVRITVLIVSILGILTTKASLGLTFVTAPHKRAPSDSPSSRFLPSRTRAHR